MFFAEIKATIEAHLLCVLTQRNNMNICHFSWNSGWTSISSRYVLILKCFFFQATGVTAFAHFDEYLRLERLEAFVEKLKTAIFHRTYYSYEDEDEDSELWEWDEMEDAEEEEAESEVDQGIIVLETWG